MPRDFEDLKKLAVRCVKVGVRSTDEDAAAMLLETAETLLEFTSSESTDTKKTNGHGTLNP